MHGNDHGTYETGETGRSGESVMVADPAGTRFDGFDGMETPTKLLPADCIRIARVARAEMFARRARASAQPKKVCANRIQVRPHTFVAVAPDPNDMARAVSAFMGRNLVPSSVNLSSSHSRR